MVAPYCDGVNLNCGCPQSWAISEGVGCALMRKPELVAEMVREAKKRTGNGFSVSVKMRIHADLEETKRYGNCPWVKLDGVWWEVLRGRIGLCGLRKAS